MKSYTSEEAKKYNNVGILFHELGHVTVSDENDIKITRDYIESQEMIIEETTFIKDGYKYFRFEWYGEYKTL